MSRNNQSVTKASPKGVRIRKAGGGRHKIPSRERKKAATIRLRDATRELLEDDFGKIQRAFDFLCSRHRKLRNSKEYKSQVREFLDHISGG